MKKVVELQLGYPDAENYKRKENKSILDRVFLRNRYLDTLCEPGISFLIGEKGTGKTAYAVYMTNNNYKETHSRIRYIRETEYQKFITLKRKAHIEISEFSSIWKVIIYLLMAEQIVEKEGCHSFFTRFGKISYVKGAIDEYYHKAFSPEIVQALQFIEESKHAAELMSKHAKAAGEEKETFTFTESRFQLNLYYIQRKFEDALKQIKTERNYIIFIDGIDIRPSSIPYGEYLECIKGLANAAWEVNNDFFPTISGSKGRLRVVLLIRPDIFNSLGLQNQNTKCRDNAVFLDWRTEYRNHRTSDIFRVTEHLLASQQEEKHTDGSVWDRYFPWNAPNIADKYEHKTSFLSFLRWSYYRPRDIITMMQILQENAKQANSNSTSISYEEFDNSTFKRKYSDYLLGEIKDQLTFYYGDEEYELFLKFFEYLNGKARFEYTEFETAYATFEKMSLSKSTVKPRFMANNQTFLQFLYDLNIICYYDLPEFDVPYPRWCFRERSFANISPKIKEGATYQIFYGLYKALNVGQEFRSKSL